MISDSVSKRILTWFLRTDGNIWNWPLIIRRTVIPVLCNSNYSGSFGILKVVNFPTVTSRTAIRTGTTNPRKFYPGGGLPELILSAITGTVTIAAIIAPSITPGIHFLNFIIYTSCDFLIICKNHLKVFFSILFLIKNERRFKK